MLVGRQAERRSIDALLDGARDEQSAVLVLRGPPGIGKTALLEYAAERADGMRVLRCTGVEAEHELPFAALHQLVRPCLDLVDRLPPPQGTALRGALGLSSEHVDNRFLVSLGLLSLLAEACESGPLACVVDDAQWLDRPSSDALLFAARRLEAEPIAVLMAAREGDLRRFDAPGLPELELHGLDGDDSRELLATRLDGGAAPEVIDSLLASADGNPLALLELPMALSTAQLRGAEPVLGPPPVRGAVEEQFRARVASLAPQARRFLLVAAADETGDVDTVTRAAAQLGLDRSELEVAERDGLVRLNGSVAFRHPLVRSAVYRSASREDRRAVHEALAAVLDDPIRSVWHRALVAEGADEGIAAELEAAATQAAGRGAATTASAAFERAAELTAEPHRRGGRLRQAAQASLDAGRPDAAMGLVERARPLISDPVEGAMLTLIQAAEASRRGSPAEGHKLLMEAGRAFAERAPDQAYELTLWALFAGFQGAWAEQVAPGIERQLASIGGDGELQRFGGVLLRGVSLLADGDGAGAHDLLARALEAGLGLTPEERRVGAEPRGGGSGRERRSGSLLTMSAFVCFLTADFPTARQLLMHAVADHRQTGSLEHIAGTLPPLAHSQVLERRIKEASVTIAEALDIARPAGYENDVSALLALKGRVAAVEGREAEARECCEEALRRGLANGVGWAVNHARVGLAEVELGLGHPREALDHLDSVTSAYFQPMAPMAAPDVIDAALRLDERERADAELRRLERWCPVTDASQPRELLVRSRAVLAEDPGEADRLFAEALDIPAFDIPPYERARTQLAYGERLRRDRRKSEARAQLRTALDTFEGLGTTPWAERARAELNATGERARKRDVSTVDDLTPQELRIAQLVAAGATNRDAAAQLFVSPKTVEYHLRKVFLKLGVSSRVELARAPLGDADEGPD